MAICRTQKGDTIHASRFAGSGRHRCLVLSLGDGWMADVSPHLHPLFREDGKMVAKSGVPTGQPRSVSLVDRDLCEILIAPPVPRALRPMWFRGKLLECVSIFGAAPAAALMRGGDRNVTEAAFEVGYSSLSHFTKAFMTEKGMCPSDYRNA